jgi:hypothetical protein
MVVLFILYQLAAVTVGRARVDVWTPLEASDHNMDTTQDSGITLAQYGGKVDVLLV